MAQEMVIENDVVGHRFIVHLPAGTGELIYRVPRAGVIELYHTQVDPALREHGVAAALAKHGFDYAREQGLGVVVTCPYIKAWVTRHPEVADIVMAR